MGQDTDRDELIRLQNEWMAAWRDGDEAALERIIGDGFTLTSARTDQLMDRATWLATAAAGRVKCESFEYRDFHVLLHGDAAVVKSRMAQVASVDGQPWNETFSLTDVWFRRDGRWQVVARHSSTPPAKDF